MEKTPKKGGDLAFQRYVNEAVPEEQKVDPSRPDNTYELDYVYGFSGCKTRQCLYFGKTNDELIYPAAALGISHSVSSNTQKFFGGAEKDAEAEKYLKNYPYH